MEPKLVTNNSATTTFDALGITEERANEIKDLAEKSVKESGTKSEAISAIWNGLEKPEEAAYGLFLMSAAEEHAFLGGLFAGEPMEG